MKEAGKLFYTENVSVFLEQDLAMFVIWSGRRKISI